MDGLRALYLARSLVTANSEEATKCHQLFLAGMYALIVMIRTASIW